jgi:hypothetical protein
MNASLLTVDPRLQSKPSAWRCRRLRSTNISIALTGISLPGITDQLAGFLDESAIHLELPETEFPIGVGQDLFDVGIRKVSEPVFLAAHAFCSDLSRTEAAISATDRRENRLARA